MENDPIRLRRQLEADGLDARGLRAQLADGTLERVRHGVYAGPDPGHPSEWAGRRATHLRLLAATLPVIHADSVVSHMSAAALHGLPLRWTDLDRVAVTREGGAHGRTARGFVLHTSHLAEDEVVEVDGTRVTSVARTVADLALSTTFEWGVVMADAALRAGASREDLLAAVDRYPRRPRVAQARRVITFANPLAESPAESMSRAQMAQALLPLPLLQYPVTLDGAFVARADFGWEQFRLVGEVDGKQKYEQLLKPGQTVADVVAAEKRREEAIRQAGWWVTRWDWETACNRAALAAHLQRAFRAAAARAA